MFANINKKSYPAKGRDNKRREVSRKEASYDLKSQLIRMCKAFNKGVEHYHESIAAWQPVLRSKRFESIALNESINLALMKEFPNEWMFGKYRRFILRINGYLIFVKKLDKHDKPSNIKTKHVNTVSNQLALPLFSDEDAYTEPILFFGYSKDKQGEISSPRVVYIDEDQVKWIITENEVMTINLNEKSLNINKGNNIAGEPEVKLKDKIINNIKKVD